MSNMTSARLKKIYKQSTLKPPYTKLPLTKRYWIYQWERLPLIPLILMGLAVGSSVTVANDVFSWPHVVASTVLVTAYLLQIRFADEPKDFEHDNKFYPTRPVQRGVITLSELLFLRNIMIGLFFVAAISLGSLTVFLLACCQQLYSLLTRKEFFVRDWLRKHFLTYMFSHYFQLLILSMLTMTMLNIPNPQKPIYFLFAILLMALVELARKIQEADNDDAGDTYSATLGRSRAIAFFLSIVLTLGVYTGWLVDRVSGDMRAAWIVVSGVALMFYLAIRYLQKPNKDNTKLLQAGSLLYYFICAIGLFLGASA